jgi:hypothetical protein
MTAPIRDMAGLVEAIRRRKDELNISNETIDAIAGFQSGYAGKVLAPKPIRHVGYMSLGLILGALGVGLQVVEDEEIRVKVEGRWTRRKRVVPTAAASISQIDQKPADLLAQIIKDHMRNIGAKGNEMGAASKGGKQRAKLLGKRARQRIATHAARKRWSKNRKDGP